MQQYAYVPHHHLGWWSQATNVSSFFLTKWMGCNRQGLLTWRFFTLGDAGDCLKVSWCPGNKIYKHPGNDEIMKFRIVPCRGSKPSTPRAVLPWPPPGGTPGAARRNSSMISGLQLPRMGGGAGRRASGAGMSSVAMARRGARSGQKTCGVTSIHRDHGHVIVMWLSWYFMVCHGGMVWYDMASHGMEWYVYFNYNWSVMVCGYGYLRVQDSGIVSQ